MDWNIRPRSEVCAISEKPFEDGETFYTILMQTSEGLQRQDLSEKAWEDRNDNVRPLCFWRAVFKPAPPEEPETVSKNDAETQLRRMLEQRDPTQAKLCALLALLLERKRILRVREHAEVDGARVTVYEHTETQETFLIPDVDFKLSELESLQKELSQGNHVFAQPANL
jgi:hypothetical protein